MQLRVDFRIFKAFNWICFYECSIIKKALKISFMAMPIKIVIYRNIFKTPFWFWIFYLSIFISIYLFIYLSICLKTIYIKTNDTNLLELYMQKNKKGNSLLNFRHGKRWVFQNIFCLPIIYIYIIYIYNIYIIYI